MAMNHLFAASLILLLAMRADGSGIPGDGIPDFYYFQSDGSAMTSVGEITRNAGVLTIDTDRVELVAFRVAGWEIGPTPDASLPTCLTCEGMALPRFDWPFGYSNYTNVPKDNSTFWIKTNPLDGSGFSGVVGEAYFGTDGTPQPWPQDVMLVDFPEIGLAELPPGLSTADFPPLIGDTSGSFGSAQWFEAYSGETGITFVTVIPEPSFSAWAYGAFGWLTAALFTRGRALRFKRWPDAPNHSSVTR